MESLEDAGHIGAGLRVGRCGLCGPVDVLVAALLAGWEDRSRLQGAAPRVELPVEQGHAHGSQDQIDDAERHGPAIHDTIMESNADYVKENARSVDDERRLDRLDGVLAVHRPEHGDQEQEVVELIRPVAPGAQHGIRDEEEVHKGHQLHTHERGSHQFVEVGHDVALLSLSCSADADAAVTAISLSLAPFALPRSGDGENKNK